MFNEETIGERGRDLQCYFLSNLSSSDLQWPRVSLPKTKAFLKTSISRSLGSDPEEPPESLSSKSLRSPLIFGATSHEEMGQAEPTLAFPFCVPNSCFQNGFCFGELEICKLYYSFNQYSNRHLLSSSSVAANNGGCNGVQPGPAFLRSEPLYRPQLCCDLWETPSASAWTCPRYLGRGPPCSLTWTVHFPLHPHLTFTFKSMLFHLKPPKPVSRHLRKGLA